MKYEYNTGESENYPVRMGVERWFTSRVNQETGYFDVPEDHDKIEAIEERLQELGHEPVESTTEEPEGDTDPLSGLTEDDIVGMGYDTLRSIASDLDDVDGRMSKDKIQEELILKVRDE